MNGVMRRVSEERSGTGAGAGGHPIGQWVRCQIVAKGQVAHGFVVKSGDLEAGTTARKHQIEPLID